MLSFEDCPSPPAQLLATQHANSVLVYRYGMAHSLAEAGVRSYVMYRLCQCIEIVALREALASLLQVVGVIACCPGEGKGFLDHGMPLRFG